MTVGEICQTSVVTAYPDQTVVEAARRMRDEHVGDVVVIDNAACPVGILTDRDIVVSGLAQSPAQLTDLLVGDLMTREVLTARRDDTLESALTKMQSGGVRRLPVVTDDGRLDGILAFDDVVAIVAGELRGLVSLVAREQRQERAHRKTHVGPASG